MADHTTPKYRFVLADIRRRIADGEWPPGHRLPSTRELTEMYRVGSAGTVRQAILLLIESGELHGHKGAGVYVAGAPPEHRVP